MNKMMYATFAMAPLVVLVAACSSTPATNPIETSSVTQPSAASAIAGAPANAAKSNGGTRVVAGQPSRIYTLVSFDKSCRPVKPTILLDKQPAKGTVSFQSGAMTTVQYSASGNCLGKSMPGTVVSYTARAGEQGADSFSISARSKSGEVGTRAFNVRIAQ